MAEKVEYVPREKIRDFLFAWSPPYIIQEVGPVTIFNTQDGPEMASAGFLVTMKESR